MKFAFRVDYATSIGMGHVRRCLTLADEALRLGHQSIFVLSSVDTHSDRLITDRGHRVARIPFTPSSTWDLKRNPKWTDPNLLADELDDAFASVAALNIYRPDFVILDHYFMTQRWVDLVRSCISARFVALEDLDRTWEDIEYVVNGNLDANVGLTEGSRARTLLGPRFAFLSREYRDIRRERLLPVEDRNRVLIFAGGGNTVGLAAAFLRIVSNSPLEVDVVASSTSPQLGDLRREVEATRGALLHIDVPSLGLLYSQARMALGAGGTSSWERACLGVPALVTSVAENQVSVCESLDQHGLAKYIGPVNELNESHVSALFHDLLSSPGELRAMSQAGMHFVDGFGTTRTLHTMTGVSDKGRLRKADIGDAIVLHEWVNDPEVIRNSKSQKRISWNDHSLWFQSRLTSSDSQLFILEVSELPVGQIRFDRAGDRLTLTYSIDRDFRSQGLGKFIVEAGLRTVQTQGAQWIEAVVRRENLASARVFSGLKFTLSQSDGGPFLRFIKEVGSQSA